MVGTDSWVWGLIAPPLLSPAVRASEGGHRRLRRLAARPRRCSAPVRTAGYTSCKVAILSAVAIVNHGLPSGATVMPVGCVPLTAFDWLMITPAALISWMSPVVVRVNHMAPPAVGAGCSRAPPPADHARAVGGGGGWAAGA